MLRSRKTWKMQRRHTLSILLLNALWAAAVCSGNPDFCNRSELTARFQKPEAVIIDSRMSRKEALAGSKAPAAILRQQVLLDVRYYGFDGRLHQGQIVVNRALRTDVLAIFRDIRASRFPIKKVVPIVKYHWNDDLSIQDNNTSGFNYRLVEGTNRFSRHAGGRAIDVNPYLNPYIRGGRRANYRRYRPGTPGTLVSGDAVVTAFKRRGWRWGGAWRGEKDYQHFDKKEERRVLKAAGAVSERWIPNYTISNQVSPLSLCQACCLRNASVSQRVLF